MSVKNMFSWIIIIVYGNEIFPSKSFNTYHCSLLLCSNDTHMYIDVEKEKKNSNMWCIQNVISNDEPYRKQMICKYGKKKLKLSSCHRLYTLHKSPMITEVLCIFRWVNALQKTDELVIVRMSYAFPHAITDYALLQLHRWVYRKGKKKHKWNVLISTYPYSWDAIFAKGFFLSNSIYFPFWISNIQTN